MKKFLSQPKIILISLLSIAIVLRLLSFGWNVIPHGDVKEDALASASFLKNGHFIKRQGRKISNPTSPSLAFVGRGINLFTGAEAIIRKQFFFF